MTDERPNALPTDLLHAEVCATYARLAEEPDGDYHFHRGPHYAARLLGYDPAELASLPEVSTAPFAGVGNPHRAGPIRPGETVADVGCGAGMDLLVAARKVGPTGRAIGIDLTPGMRERAARGAEQAGLAGVVEVRAGMAEALPLPDASVDVVQSNGVLNLVADKARALREMRRVLRPGGRLHLADVLVARPIKSDARDRVELWAACVAGALSEGELLLLAAAAGLEGGRIVERFPAYRGTSAEAKVSAELRLGGMTFLARR